MSNEGKTCRISRRAFIRATAGAVGGAILAGCAPQVVKETVVVEKPVEVVVKEVVKETVIVEGTPQVVEKTVEKIITATPAPKDPVEVLWWFAHGGAIGELMLQFAADFSEANGDVTIQAEHQGTYTEHVNKLIAAAMTDTLPDMIHNGDGHNPNLARGGILLGLDELIAQSKVVDLSEYRQAVERGIINGKLYQICFGVSTPILYYNKDAVDAAGLEGAPDTWEAFFTEYAPKLTTADMVAFGYNPGHWWQQSAMWGNGVMVNDDNWEMDYANPAAVEWFERMQAVRRDGQLHVPTAADGKAVGFFGSGMSAMTCASTGAINNVDGIADGKFVAEVGYLPAGTAGRLIPSGGNGLSITRGVSNEARDAAWRFIEYLQTPEQIVTYCKQTGYLPFTDTTEVMMADHIAADPRRQVAVEQLGFSRWQLKPVTIARSQAELKDAWNECVQTDVNVKERLERLQETLAKIVREEGFEPILPS